ncbi:MAG: hypothetical protein ACLQVD_22105 [Capsulimonadaceae bacterium]
MKPHLALTLVLAAAMAGGARAQTGSTTQLSGDSHGGVVAPSSLSATATPENGSSQQSIGLLYTPAENTMPPAAVVPAPILPLKISDAERTYYDFGYTLATGAFTYADLAKQAMAIAPSSSGRQPAGVDILASLSPTALRDRGVVRTNLERTLSDMEALHASSDAVAVVRQAVDLVSKPLVATGDAADLAAVNPQAAQTLEALNEFEKIGGITESPAISAWLQGPGHSGVGNVWYAEGLISGVVEIASAQNMPELLPPVSEVATDLRGLRDWLVLRMPEEPSPDQAALRTSLDAFLEETSWPKVQDRPVTHSELVSLGVISHQLQMQVLTQSVVARPLPAGSTFTGSALAQHQPPTAAQPGAEQVADAKKPS